MIESDVWQVVLGAALAVTGGMLGELWRELRANRADVRLLRGEVEGLIVMCDIYLRPSPEISISHYLAQLRSFATEGAVSRPWLRAITDREERAEVLQLYAIASSLVANLERLVGRETLARNANNQDAFRDAVRQNRELALEGLTLLRRSAEKVSKMLEAAEGRLLLV